MSTPFYRGYHIHMKFQIILITMFKEKFLKIFLGFTFQDQNWVTTTRSKRPKLYQFQIKLIQLDTQIIQGHITGKIQFNLIGHVCFPFHYD